MDYVNANVLKDYLLMIIPQLKIIIDNSLTKGIFPAKWAQGTIIPIPKKGDMSNLSNWRPITLLPAMSKIMERVVHSQLMDHMMENHLLSKFQFGFTPGRSTADAVHELGQHIYSAINKGKLSSCLFIDMRKAFDTVHHGRLLNKLGQLGANTCVLKWFCSYLSQRKHKTLANNKLSDLTHVTFGVPQGSILGPLLFSVYINELPECIDNSKVILYADDAVMMTEGKTAADITRIGQPDLDKILDWCALNRLTINSDKTVQVVYGTKPKTSTVKPPLLKIGDDDVVAQKSFSYLGVTLDENMKLDTHISVIKKSCGYKLYQSHKVRTYINRNDALTIYKHCTLPSLEYCSFMLDSANKVNQRKLQVLQNKGLRDCLQIRDPQEISEIELHQECQISNLSRRRDSQLLLHIHKLAKDSDNLVTIERVRTRGDVKVRLIAPRAKLRVVKKSPLHRGLILWNTLDADTQKIDSRAAFKQAIERIDFTEIKARHNMY